MCILTIRLQEVNKRILTEYNSMFTTIHEQEGNNNIYLLNFCLNSKIVITVK